jgi:hypothetical protein
VVATVVPIRNRMLATGEGARKGREVECNCRHLYHNKDALAGGPALRLVGYVYGMESISGCSLFMGGSLLNQSHTDGFSGSATLRSRISTNSTAHFEFRGLLLTIISSNLQTYTT